MDLTIIKEELYQSVLRQLMKFAESDKARDVYAVTFDLDEFDYVMRYQTLAGYGEVKNEYLSQNADKEDYFANESLTGFKYEVGDFGFIQDIAEEKFGAGVALKDFFDSMAYYACDYIEDESRLISREELPEDLYEFLLEACLYSAEKLKENLDFLNKTDDFIIFVTEHDVTEERKLETISKTVCPELFEKLCNK